MSRYLTPGVELGVERAPLLRTDSHTPGLWGPLRLSKRSIGLTCVLEREPWVTTQTSGSEVVTALAKVSSFRVPTMETVVIVKMPFIHYHNVRFHPTSEMKPLFN